MRYKDTDAVVVTDMDERIENVVETIKSVIFCELRQKFSNEETLEIFAKIDEAVKSCEAEQLKAF